MKRSTRHTGKKRYKEMDGHPIMRIALFLLVTIILSSCVIIQEDDTITRILDTNSDISSYVAESTKHTRMSYTLGEMVDELVEAENSTTWVDLDAQKILITTESTVAYGADSERTEESLYVEGGDLYMQMPYEPYLWAHAQNGMSFEALTEFLVTYVPVPNLFNVLQPEDLTITDRGERYVLEVERQTLLSMQFGELFQDDEPSPEDMTITMTLYVNRNTLLVEEVVNTVEGSDHEGGMTMELSQTARTMISSINEPLTIERPFDDEELLIFD